MGMRMAQFSDDLQYLLYLKKDKKGSFQAAVANYIKLPSRLSAGQTVTCWMRLPLVSTFLGRWRDGASRRRSKNGVAAKRWESNINTWKMDGKWMNISSTHIENHLEIIIDTL